MKNAKKKQIIVGMSGGVDSSVAALLLKEDGWGVAGVFMRNWDEEDDESCSAAQDLIDAATVCKKLDIPLHTLNLSAEYRREVFDKMISGYRNGITPNPDILCNREIKFKAFSRHAQTLGGTYIATGHYARLEEDENGEPLLKKGVDEKKDQSYFLYAVNRTIFKQVVFPLGELRKTEVRTLAKNAGFPNHNKKDSTGICFIGPRKFRAFLKRYAPAEPGEIIDTEGRVLGQHEGHMCYTLGQRKGLGVGGIAETENNPWYVIRKDAQRNLLYVAQGEHQALYALELSAGEMNWQLPPQRDEFPCQARIRHGQADQACVVRIENNAGSPRCTARFKNPQRAITAGQAVVFYDRDICLGGGTIQEVTSQAAPSFTA